MAAKMVEYLVAKSDKLKVVSKVVSTGALLDTQLVEERAVTKGN